MGRSGRKKICLHKDIPIAVLVECLRIKNFKLGHVPSSVQTFLNQPFIRKLALRILIEESGMEKIERVSPPLNRPTHFIYECVGVESRYQ